MMELQRPLETFSTLDGSIVSLSRLHVGNIRTHFRWNNDRSLHELEYDQPFRAESYGSFARRFVSMRDSTLDGLYLEIHTSDPDGLLVGVASLTGWDASHRRAEISVCIGDEAARRRGYGRAALDLLLNLAFEDLGLHRVSATALAFNPGWRSLLKTAGFQREGCQREHVRRDGAFWDKESWGLLAREHYAVRRVAA